MRKKIHQHLSLTTSDRQQVAKELHEIRKEIDEIRSEDNSQKIKLLIAKVYCSYYNSQKRSGIFPAPFLILRLTVRRL